MNPTSAGPAFFGFPVLNSPEKCGVVIPGQEVSRASSRLSLKVFCTVADWIWTCVQRSRPKGAPPSMRNKMQCLGDSSLSIKTNIATRSCLRSANLPNTSHSSGQCICKKVANRAKAGCFLRSTRLSRKPTFTCILTSHLLNSLKNTILDGNAQASA